MSHIQGQPHPEGTTEHLDYIRIDVDPTGALTQVAVVTHHRFHELDLPQHVTVYHARPSPGQRHLNHAAPPTRRTTLQGFITALATAASLAETPDDPAPPVADS